MIAFTPKHTNRKRLIIATALTVVLAFGLKMTTSLALAAGTTPVAGEKIITIHDGGSQQGVVTTATTLREALQQAHIRLDSNDLTEPGLDEPLVASSYEANIYRARTVVIQDGAVRTRLVTAYRTGKQIAKQAGINLLDADTASLAPSKDIISDGAGEVLSISYAPRITFVFYGKTLQTSTRATTVGDMLKQKGITVAADDTLSVPLTTPVTTGLKVELWKNGKQTATTEEDIAFTTRQIQDANHDQGYKEVQTAGVAGKKTVTYEIIMQNGKEVQRTVVNSVITKPAVEQVEVIGVKGKYTTPTENEVITWNFLIGKGLSREQAAGIMGNLMQEHGFNTTGDGLAQWTGSRQSRLRSMYPTTYDTIQSQLDYLWYELSGPYASVLTAIKAQTTVAGAVVVFQNQFERCGVCVESRRIQFAQNILASH